jgi:hypothetical protein
MLSPSFFFFLFFPALRVPSKREQEIKRITFVHLAVGGCRPTDPFRSSAVPTCSTLYHIPFFTPFIKLGYKEALCARCPYSSQVL